MKFESWVHRVQRIPETESQWRVHTSTVTVAVMPEAEDVDIQIDMKDIVMDTYAASSNWWQNANKNQTGVRIHHIPSWLIVNIWDSKSQIQNKEKALFNVNAEMPHTDGKHNWCNTREELQEFDPDLYNLLAEYFPKTTLQISKHKKVNEYGKYQ